MIATRTYVEMTDGAALRPARLSGEALSITRHDSCEPSLWRHLYSEVGRDYRWLDRLPWTDAEARAYLNDPAVSLWTLTANGTLAGYFELRREPDGAIEIVYFGLLPGFMGRGLGAHLLTEAVDTAWSLGARRVWLHTCSFDHPVALSNYLKRGFTIFKTEEYEVQD